MLFFYICILSLFSFLVIFSSFLIRCAASLVAGCPPSKRTGRVRFPGGAFFFQNPFKVTWLPSTPSQLQVFLISGMSVCFQNGDSKIVSRSFFFFVLLSLGWNLDGETLCCGSSLCLNFLFWEKVSFLESSLNYLPLRGPRDESRVSSSALNVNSTILC